MFTSEAVKVKAVVMNKLVGRGNVDMENRCVARKKIRKGIHQLFACEVPFPKRILTYFLL